MSKKQKNVGSASQVEAATSVQSAEMTAQVNNDTANVSCSEFTPDHFVKINEADWHNVKDLQIGETYMRRDGSHYVTIVEVFNGTSGLAHGHYHVLIDGNEIEATNERAVYNGVVTIWSPALKQYLTCEASELKQQSVKYKDPNTSTGGGRSLYDLKNVVTSNYRERGEKSLDNAAKCVAAAIKAVKVLTDAVDTQLFGVDALECLKIALTDNREVYLGMLSDVAAANDQRKQERDDLQAQIAELQKKLNALKKSA